MKNSIRTYCANLTKIICPTWSTLMFFFLTTASTGCSNAIPEEDETTGGTPSEVKIETRSTDGVDIGYPLMLYAFDTDEGKMVASAEAKTADDTPSMRLNKGSYRLVAVSGTGDLQLPETPTLTSSLGIPTNGILTEALQHGTAEVVVADRDVNAHISLAYQVAQVALELKNIPIGVTAVNVSVSTLYADEDFDGNYTGSSTATVPLAATDQEGMWSAIAYLLPSTDNQFIMSIALTDAEDTTHYDYTHTFPLRAGTPYRLTGSFDETFEVNSVLSFEGWDSQESTDFTFGTEGGKEEKPETDTDGNYLVSTIPTAKSLWEGHFVASVSDATETSATLLLLSQKEWTVLPADAAATVAGYAEGDMSGWEIPTAAQLCALSMPLAANANLSGTNSLLEDDLSQGAYLCEGAEKQVALGQNSTASMVILTSAAYRLRAVKRVSVSIP